MRKFINIVLSAIVLLWPVYVMGQSGIGIPSLKIIPGARMAGMAGPYAGMGDDVYTLYSNPGGLGHIRRWQWALGYNRWFTDVYQADVSFAKQVRMWGSVKTGFGLFASTVGMPSWDATGGKEASVSAEHWIAGFSIGQRLDWLNRSLSAGMNVKMIHNRLESYSSTGPALDAGLLLKPGRFRMGLLGMGVFDYGIFSAGVSILHLGPKMVFMSEGSLLPTTVHTGGSLQVGRYGGWSCLLAADWTMVRGRDGFVSTGAEIWWKNLLGCRVGYRADGKDLGDFNLGFGMRWENAVASLLGLPSRYGDAFQADFAEAGYGDVLKQTYRGTVIHYPLSPEPFELGEPKEKKPDTKNESTSVYLEWEKAFDPDPFDEVRYFLMVDQNRAKIESAIRRMEHDFQISGNAAELEKELFYCVEIPSNSHLVSVKEGGIYYWAVAALDRSNHAQMAKRGVEKLGQFIVAVPDLFVRNIRFDPVNTITTTSEQGILFVTLSNQGSATSGIFGLLVQSRPILQGTPHSDVFQTVLSETVFSLPVDKDTTLSISWKTDLPGWYEIRAQVDPDSAVVEYREDNNTESIRIATVPKGEITAADSAEVMITGYDSAEIPMVPEVYFAPHSSAVDSTFTSRGGTFPPLLPTLADRLNASPAIQLKLYGSIDLLSGEKDPVLADERAEAVRFSLIQQGVAKDRLEVVKEHPNKILGKRPMPPNPQDAEWIMQQNRLVSFSVRKEDEETLFQSYRFAVDTTMRDSVQFHIRVISSTGIRLWNVPSRFSVLDIRKKPASQTDSLSGEFSWKGTDQNKVVVARNQWVLYSLVLMDTLGRTFKTIPDSIYIQEKRTVQKQTLFGAAKFAQVEPVYSFYWDRVMEVADEMIQDSSLRLRFEGHACAIGPDKVNERLSIERARAFTQAFLNRIKNAYPLEYQNIMRRLSPPIGFGEREPLLIKLKGYGDVLLGNNQSPVGRYLNRRIAVLLYREN